MKWFLFLVFFAGISVSQLSFAQKREITVVIDPGHGGHDPGHESSFSGHLDEKDLNLKISKFLGGYIEKYLQNVKVIYTRTTDVYPSLDKRVDKANRIGADYFISIHCNGNDNKNVRGTETIVHSMKAKKAVLLARQIERQFSKRAGRKSRGVKNKEDLRHSIQVLKYTRMTSVLIECGFLTNKKEANYLNGTYGQEIIASAIFRGFRTFIQKEHPSINFIRPKGGAASTTGAYAIQIMSSKEPVDVNSSSFKRLKMPIKRTKLNTTSAYKYIYTVGDYANRAEAKKDLSKVQSRGFKDAIIVKR